MLTKQDGIANGGRIYGLNTPVQEFISEDYYRHATSYFLTPEQQTSTLSTLERTPDGKVAQSAQLLGMESFAWNKLRVLDGDLSTLDAPNTHNIAAVYTKNDYGTPQMDSHWAKLSDTFTLCYVDEWNYYDPVTNELLDPTQLADTPDYLFRAKNYRDITYTVTALVSVPHPLSYRYYGADEFVLGDKTFVEDTQSADVMLYTFDMQDDVSTAQMESFLADFTQDSTFDYESRMTYIAEFESFRAMFLLLGSLLSLIVGRLAF